MFTSYVNTEAGTEFEQSVRQYAQQVYPMKPHYINEDLENNEEAKKLGKTSLTKDEAFQGLKWKAEAPLKYIPAIESALVDGSRRPTAYGETFTRLTIQPDFVTGKQIFVKENIHIYEMEKKIIFLGCEVNIEEAKHYLKKSEENHVEENMKSHKPTLFNVEHAITGTDKAPIATWKMIRINDANFLEPAEAERIEKLRAFIQSIPGTHISLQTIRQSIESSNTLVLQMNLK